MAYQGRDIIILLVVMMIWGGNFAVAKIGMEQLTPLFFITLRFAVVALFLVPFVKPPRGRFAQVFAVSLTLGVLHFAFMFTALQTLDAAAAAITVQLQVPIASLLAWLVFKDALGWRRGFGMALAFLGVLPVSDVLNGTGHTDGFPSTVQLGLAMCPEPTCIAPGFLDSGLTVFASTLPRPAR